MPSPTVWDAPAGPEPILNAAGALQHPDLARPRTGPRGARLGIPPASVPVGLVSFDETQAWKCTGKVAVKQDGIILSLTWIPSLSWAANGLPERQFQACIPMKSQNSSAK